MHFVPPCGGCIDGPMQRLPNLSGNEADFGLDFGPQDTQPVNHETSIWFDEFVSRPASVRRRLTRRVEGFAQAIHSL